MIGDRNQQYSHSKNHFSLSRPYFFRDDTTWCVRRAKQIPAWKNVYYIVTRDMIIVGIILLMLCMLMIYLVTSFEDRQMDIWSSIIMNFQIIMLLPVHMDPKRSITRVLLGIGLLLVLATTTTFLAFYYNFMLQLVNNGSVN